MPVVLDVSAAVQILLKTEKGAKFEQAHDNAERCLTPALYIFELSNVLWKYERKLAVTAAEGEQYIIDGIDLIDEFIDATELWREAFALGVKNNHSIYDMYYAVLARRYNGTLITNDGDFAKICARENIRCCI